MHEYQLWCQKNLPVGTEIVTQVKFIIFGAHSKEREPFVYPSCYLGQHHSKPYSYQGAFAQGWRFLHGIETQMVLETSILSNS